MHRWWLIFGILWLSCAPASAEPDFPDLTDRIVDTAGLLPPDETASLIAQLEQHETQTSNQIVVVTVPDLQGYDIADYANRLGRHWGIGQQELNNGVLLVIAPDERKVRIEVGYGLEGALPDATASDIIRRQILPSFREDEYPAGIGKGVTSIISAIAGEYEPQPIKARDKSNGAIALPFIGFIAIMQLIAARGNRKLGRAAFPAGFVGIFVSAISGHIVWGILAAAAAFFILFVFVKPGSGAGRNGSSQRDENRRHRQGGSSGGSGFGGGGGSFGGGGASGSW